MKKIVVICVVTATMILFASTAVYAGCNTLWVTAMGAYHIDISDISCAHGTSKNESGDSVDLVSGGFYGPDCTVVFSTYDEKNQAAVRFQQNYCGLEAGDITVEPIYGQKPIYRIDNGSRGDNSSGEVRITGWE